MAYTGTYRVGGATFNDRKVGEAFKKALQKSTPGFQGLKAGQFFTGEGGTQYKTVSGIDPNKPGWGQLVDPEYRLIGYQGGAQPTGRARGMGIGEATPGFAILQKIGQPKVEEPITGTEEGTDPRDPGGSGTKPLVTDGETGGETGGEQSQDTSTQDMIDAITAAVEKLSGGFGTAIEGIGTEFAKIAGAQDDRMAKLQEIMMQSQAMNQQRPEVAGVKMATGPAGNLMQIARRGVTGAFGRRGMRISSLNV